MNLRCAGLVCLVLSIGCGGDDDGGGGTADAGNVDAGADVDAASPDAAPEPDLTAGEIEDMCSAMCGSAADCEVLDSVGGEDCMEDCADALEADPTYVATIVCTTAAACPDFDTCLGDIPIDPACTALCEPVLECGYDGLLNLADPLLCEAQCSGALHADNPEVDEILDCYSTGLEDGCNFFGIIDCNPNDELQVPPCVDLCEPVGACGDETNLGADFADADACLTYCDALTDGQRADFTVCTMVGGCDAAECDQIPDAPPAACVTGCGSLADTCDAAQGYAAEVCSHKCSGLHRIPADHELAGFTGCTSGLDECPQQTNDDPLFGPLSDVYDLGLQYCLLQPSSTCQSVCADTVMCGINDENTYECEIDCAIAEQEGSDAPASQKACLDEIDRDQTQEEICADVGACTT